MELTSIASDATHKPPLRSLRSLSPTGHDFSQRTESPACKCKVTILQRFENAITQR
jgi:hypothetical protein